LLLEITRGRKIISISIAMNILKNILKNNYYRTFKHHQIKEYV
jgi:metal-dependent HD superfamily phosphatase/phosphodiesterase